MSGEVDAVLTPAQPIFSLDLEANGGVFAPKSFQEAQEWLQTENGFWAWLRDRQNGNHTSGFRQALSHLTNAQNHLQQAQQHTSNNRQHYEQQLQAAQNAVREALVVCRLPHSSTPLAKQIELYRSQNGEAAASCYASVFLPPTGGHGFQPQMPEAWRGLVEGIVDRYELPVAAIDRKVQAATQAFEQLRANTESFVSAKSAAIEGLHRDYAELESEMRTARGTQDGEFKEAQRQRGDTFDQLMTEHDQALDGLRKAFREEMALRAPSEYWKTKEEHHKKMSWISGAAAFGGMLVVSLVIGRLLSELLASTPVGQGPDSWRLAMVGLIGLFSVWAIRLVVRSYLSNLHLAGDAAERRVMIQTYLSLLEGGGAVGDQDRQLILQALFRPAADGIVKDEGVPPSVVDFLTRSPKA